jgi:hypothetical protein
MIPKGTRVMVTPTARAFRQNLPAANWLGDDTTGKPTTVVTLVDDAPNERTLDVIDVLTEDGRNESIYDFNIVQACVRSLIEFRRFLAQPGATVQVIQNDWNAGTSAVLGRQPKPEYWERKKVAKLQTKAVQFTTGGWLTFPLAKHVRFNGDTVTIDMNKDGTFSQVLVYKLSQEVQ